jgi:hypothetical protein
LAIRRWVAGLRIMVRGAASLTVCIVGVLVGGRTNERHDNVTHADLARHRLQVGLLQRFGRLQVGIAGRGLLLVVTGFLDALLVFVNQGDSFLGNFPLRVV